MKTLQLLELDPYLKPYENTILGRLRYIQQREKTLLTCHHGEKSLVEFASGKDYYGLHQHKDGWVFREWAPNAKAIFLVGSFNNWEEKPEYKLRHVMGSENWELSLPLNCIAHGDEYRIHVHWEDGWGSRIPSYADSVIQDPETHGFNAKVFISSHHWKTEPRKKTVSPLLIYEAHVGMASEEGKVASYLEFRDHILPLIKKAGYNAIQLMAIQEHPYYASFGYQVSNFFAPASRFGNPDDLKALIDRAHEMDLTVIMDLVHSHAAPNVLEGLSLFDGTEYQYFHSGKKGWHPAWGSRCFNYGRNEVVHFLLSNCKYWMEEFHFDGFRFDGVTSMLYLDKGLERAFSSYDDYYMHSNMDVDALAYLTLANKLIHEIRAQSITVSEDMSGLPGMALPVEGGGVGFDYRLSMGMPDHWIRTLAEHRDEHWRIGDMWHQFSSHRPEEKSVAYAESHDQALVGDKTLIFRLVDAEMYSGMSVFQHSPVVERGVALHKMIRLFSFASGGQAYLNFMGNEFGHPEWIDFPRKGNCWSHHYARRQWSLLHDKNLRYKYLAYFDRQMLECAHRHIFIQSFDQYLYYEHADDQVIAFRKGEVYLLFNFSPTQSNADYWIPFPDGDYQLILDSDAKCFDGQGRVEAGQKYISRLEKDGKGNPTGRRGIQVYLPSRTALVFVRGDADPLYKQEYFT